MRNELQEAVAHLEAMAQNAIGAAADADMPEQQKTALWAEYKALDTALTALRDVLQRQLDPDTGLMPCGCGCEPELRDDGRGWYQVYCTGCDMHGGNSHTPDGVIEEWNTAMGWRVEG
jgi:hypothetical protein